MMNDDLFKKIYSDAIEIKSSIESKDLNKELRNLDERYKVKELIGEGAVKRVFLAYDKMMDRDVALAKIKPESYEQINDFLNEARLSSNLEHPYIAPVYDLGFETDGDPYFVMKLYDGRNLREELLARKEQDIDLKDNITWILNTYLKVCEAVSFAHSKGILHLDIKPSNIRIDDYGEVLLCDWGIARYLHSNEDTSDFDFSLPENVLSRATLTGEIRGTPGFMAPEQKTKEHLFDQRTDIFGLGALLHDMLTGQPELLEKEDASLPLELRAICRKSLSQEQDNRYQSVQSLIEDVNKFQSGQVTTAENANFILVFKKWLYRHQKSILITLANLIIFGFLIFNYIRDISEGKKNLESAVQEIKSKEKDEQKAKIAQAKNYYIQGFNAYCNSVSKFDYDVDDIKLAKNLLEKSTQLNPKDLEAWALLGRLKLNLYEFNSALNDFRKAGGKYNEYAEAVEKCLPEIGSGKNKNDVYLQLISDITAFKSHDSRLRNHLIFKGIHEIGDSQKLFKFCMRAMMIVNHLDKLDYDYDHPTRSLDLKKNNINILYPMKTLRITKLNLSHNPMRSGEFYNLRRIPLTHLDVSYCNIKEMKRFFNYEIEFLNLEGNPLKDIHNVTMTNIKTINIAYTKIKLQQLTLCKMLEKVICSEDQFQKLKETLKDKVKIEVKTK
jgi:serine/threonine protein kinase